MEKPRIKKIIEEIALAIDIERRDLNYVLSMYYQYIKLLLETDEGFASLDSSCDHVVSKNSDLIKKNIENNISAEELITEKVRLIKLKKSPNSECTNLIQLILTGLATEREMLNYSNYEEYLATDMLEISVISLKNINPEFMDGFLVFSKNYN
ncbi:hypothetical protein ACT048_24995 [Ectopseudomonas khazarica]|uniref:hypothetical protein n=1 Tax=Ectopseudomonas khazarica TaxID=2502979 RepID=UPI0040339649